MRRSQAGQATIEWSALLLALAFGLAALTLVVARTDAWSLGDRIVHALTCAVDGGCDERDSLGLAYGGELADAVRRHAPNIVYERRSAAPLRSRSLARASRWSWSSPQRRTARRCVR